MAEKQRRIKSAVMMVEYNVIRPKTATNMDNLSVELPNIHHPNSPRSDKIKTDLEVHDQVIIKPLAGIQRTNSRQDIILKSMFDQITDFKGPLQIKTQRSLSGDNQMLVGKTSSHFSANARRRMSVQEKIVVVKEKKVLNRNNSSPLLLKRRGSEPGLYFSKTSPPTFRSDGNTTHTTESSFGQDLVSQRENHRKDNSVHEAKEEPNEPELNFSIEKCKSWIKDLPQKFSGLNVLTFPEIHSNSGNNNDE